MSSRRSPAPILAALRRGSPPRPTVSSPAGRRAGALSFGLTLLGALGAGWCLICTGRALGALERQTEGEGGGGAPPPPPTPPPPPPPPPP